MPNIVKGFRIFFLVLNVGLGLFIGLHFAGIDLAAPKLEDGSEFYFSVYGYYIDCYPCTTVEKTSQDVIWGNQVTLNSIFKLKIKDMPDWKDGQVTNSLDSIYDDSFEYYLSNDNSFKSPKNLKYEVMDHTNALVRLVKFIDDPDRIEYFWSGGEDSAWGSGVETRTTARIDTGTDLGSFIVPESMTFTWIYDTETGLLNSFEISSPSYEFSINRYLNSLLGVHDLAEGLFLVPIFAYLFFEVIVFVVRKIKARRGSSKDIPVDTTVE